MAITCRNLLELPTLKQLKAVGGLNGLDRIIRWVHVADVPEVTNWVQGGELLFITGLGIKNEIRSILHLINEVNAKKLAGLVINVGPYIPEIPVAAIELANELDFPLFELPWAVKLVEVTEALCSLIVMHQMEEKSIQDLMENIMFNDFDAPAILMNRAAYYGYDLSKPYQVMLVDVDDFNQYLKEAEINDENKILELKFYLKQGIQQVLKDHSINTPTMLRSDSVIILLPLTEAGSDNKQLAGEIKHLVAQRLPGVSVSIGIGNYYTEIKSYKKSLFEAEQALKVAQINNTKNSICIYQELGIYRIFSKVVEKQELKSFYDEILADLLEYDRLYHANLISTLRVYLNESGNLHQAAEKLFVHRNTLKYRLQRVEEICGYSLSEAHHRLNFQVAFMIESYLDLLNPTKI